MGHRKAFNLIELSIVIALLALIAAMMVPSLAAAGRAARRADCKATLHHVYNGLTAYSTESRLRMPPFAFSTNIQGNLALSGHWGGADQASDPDAFGRKGVAWANLSSLRVRKFIWPQQLICPSAEIRGGAYFPRTSRFGSYCMRLPYSLDLFAESPALGPSSGQLLGIYLMAAGGQGVQVSDHIETVPQVRLDRRYTIDLPDMPVFDPALSPIVSDAFCFQDMSSPPSPGCAAVRRAWSHGKEFQVLKGTGAVVTVVDDGTVAANSAPPGGGLPDDGKTYATYAENVWRYFAAAK